MVRSHKLKNVYIYNLTYRGLGGIVFVVVRWSANLLTVFVSFLAVMKQIED